MQYTSPFKPIFSPIPDGKNSMPADQHRFYDIVKQFSDVQSLSELQSDIFGSSAPQPQDVAPELALPRYLEPAAAAAVAANTEKASRKRKLDDIVLAPTSVPSTAAAASKDQPQEQPQPDRSSKRRKTSASVAVATAASTTTPAPTQSASSYKPTSAASNAKQNHNRSEQQRRQRINDAIEELRVILPPQCRNLATNKLAILQESAGFMRHMKESLDALHREKERSEEAYKQLWEEHTLLRNSIAAAEGGIPAMFSPIHGHNSAVGHSSSCYPSPPPFMPLSHPTTNFDATQIVLPPSYMAYLDPNYAQL